MSCASRHYHADRGGGEQRFGLDVTLKEVLHSILFLSSLLSLYYLSLLVFYPPPIERHLRARTSRHYRYRYIITAVTANTTYHRYNISPLLLPSVDNAYYLTRIEGADHLEIPRFFTFQRGSFNISVI